MSEKYLFQPISGGTITMAPEQRAYPPYSREKAIPKILNEFVQSGKNILDIYNEDINRRLFAVYGVREDGKIISNWKYRFKQQLAKKELGVPEANPEGGRFSDLRRYIESRDQILKALNVIRVESDLNLGDFKELVKFSLEDLG